MASDVREHFKGLRNSLRNDVLLVLGYHRTINERTKRSTARGGFHSIPRQVFCYIDHIADVLYARGKVSDKAIHFIQEYLGPGQELYRKRANLIYNMWRHGTVHEYDPKVFKVETQSAHKTIGWLTNDDAKKKNRAAHLKFAQRPRRPGAHYLVMNLPQLVDDLMGALRAIIDQLKTNGTFRSECQRRFDKLSSAILAGGQVRAEILQAMTEVCLQINRRGETFGVRRK